MCIYTCGFTSVSPIVKNMEESLRLGKGHSTKFDTKLTVTHYSLPPQPAAPALPSPRGSEFTTHTAHARALCVSYDDLKSSQKYTGENRLLGDLIVS